MEEKINDIPDGWTSEDFGNLISDKKKSTLKVSDATNFGVYPFFTSGEAILLHNEKQIDGENIFLATGGVANVKYHNGEVAYSTDTYAITSNEIINVKFLFYYSQNIISYINLNYFQGSGLKHLQKKDLKKHKVDFPKTSKEQNKIADILSKVDKAISETEINIAKYNRIKTGLMQDLLTKGIDEKGNIRSEQTHEFKDSPIGRIPKDWDVLKLWEIGSKKSPYLKTGPFGSSLKTEHWVDEGIPVITIGSLGDDDFIQENLLFISEKKANELSAYKLIQDDILFSRVAEIGRSLVIKQKQSGWIMSSNFMRLRLDQNTYLSDFIYLLIKYSNAFQKQITENVNESGRSVTNSGILNSFIFPKIEINEQRKILEKINLINDFLNNLKIELNKLKSTKKGLMQDLLSGKKRVTHLIN